MQPSPIGVINLGGKVKRSRKWKKQKLHRCERRRANVNPECEPLYKRHVGWEW